ncbi:MAG: 50S ribosomal protein L9 [Actinomycetia bacterium]|nr:50S ribosomal protein L9 [Actinomycetes bacterium]MCP4962845.1 50S ribosomal protein L9 [Actinomycetes bacterium]
MKVILRTDVDGLGKTGDMIDVADGHARNFLIPGGKAMMASSGAVSQAAAMRKSRDVRDGRDRSAAEDIARQLVGQTIVVSAKAGSGGQLYGSVTTSDVAEAVAAATGIELDRRDLSIDGSIRTIGEHEVQAKLHGKVQFVINVDVAAAG